MPLNVLFLDDEPMLCEIFSETFGSSDIVIETYTEPASALEAIQKNPPQVIFIDYRLGSAHGDEIAALMPPDIPKYLMTGELEVDTDYKFVEVLAKPFDMKHIGEILKKMIP